MANVHLDAVEHKDKIVFLHAVQEGPASQSYGVAVASLAGVPRDVVRQARRKLVELEQGSISNGLQADLFAAPVIAEPEIVTHAASMRWQRLILINSRRARHLRSCIH